ncbi:MAG: exodeoxyribonuclease VII large subunit, partial [Planctomycetota bacterium]
MGRLRFDSDRVAGPAPSDAEAADENTADSPLTVSQAAALIKEALERGVPAPIWVVGEVSNLSAQQHWFFSLKDESAVLSCVAWASSVRKFDFVPSDGQQVIAAGHVSHYGPQGRTQLYVSDLKPLGAGALELRFRAMCDELRGLGYFDETRKKPLPTFPRRIAVITSAGGAAVQDVVVTAEQRCRAVGLLVVDVRVQGEGAAAQIAEAIRWVDTHDQRLGIDAVLVTRGGGSVEDLWAFNEREVADAAFACGVPLVAAIGHESDTTVIELVADVRAATPTQAVMRLVPAADQLHQQVDHLSHRLGFVLKRVVEHQRQRGERAQRDLIRILRGRVSHERSRLEQLSGRLARLAPPVVLARQRERVAVLADRLAHALRYRLTGLGGRLAALERELVAVDPDRVLGRGYSYTMHADGRLVRSAGEVRAGQRIRTRV